MKLLRQFLTIALISLIGEALRALIPLPIPASVYGMAIMLAALMTGALKLRHVKQASSFLIEIMPVMFIPAAVGLLDSWESVKPMLLPTIIAAIPLTVIVMAVTGRVAQRAIGREEEGER